MDRDAAPREALQQVIGEAQDYLENSKEYLRLQVFKMAMQLLTSLAKGLLLGSIALVALLFLSYGAAQELGAYLGNANYGYYAIGGLYVLTFILIYMFRDRLDKHVLRHFSHLYYKS
jgi:hypothetical protein